MPKSSNNMTYQNLLMHIIHGLTMETTGLCDIGKDIGPTCPSCNILQLSVQKRDFMRFDFSLQKVFQSLGPLVEELKG
jgi:hypothetical protein